MDAVNFSKIKVNFHCGGFSWQLLHKANCLYKGWHFKICIGFRIYTLEYKLRKAL